MFFRLMIYRRYIILKRKKFVWIRIWIPILQTGAHRFIKSSFRIIFINALSLCDINIKTSHLINTNKCFPHKSIVLREFRKNKMTRTGYARTILVVLQCQGCTNEFFIFVGKLTGLFVEIIRVVPSKYHCHLARLSARICISYGRGKLPAMK